LRVAIADKLQRRTLIFLQEIEQVNLVHVLEIGVWGAHMSEGDWGHEASGSRWMGVSICRKK
jgi:hypothetical protein